MELWTFVLATTRINLQQESLKQKTCRRRCHPEAKDKSFCCKKNYLTNFTFYASLKNVLIILLLIISPRRNEIKRLSLILETSCTGQYRGHLYGRRSRPRTAEERRASNRNVLSHLVRYVHAALETHRRRLAHYLPSGVRRVQLGLLEHVSQSRRRLKEETDEKEKNPL